MAGATHRINFVSNFSQSDAGIKQMIEDLRVMGQIAEAAGDKGSEGARRFFAALGNLDSRATTTSRQFATMNTLLAEMEMQWNRMGDAAKKNAGAELQKSIEQVRAKVEGLNKELQGVGAGANIGGAAGKGGGLFGKIMGGNLAARAVMDTLRFVKDTVKDAVQANMEFEYSNATLSAVLGKTKEEIMDLTIQAQRLGSTSLYSAKEISELQIVLARLGFNQTEIKDSTDAIAKLALATGVDLEKAASMTGSAMRAFGYSTKEAARVASVLGVATTKSALDMQKLQVGLSYASANANAAGFEIEEVVAMLGKMVDKGQQATTAGVNIRNIMIDLSNSSSKLRKAFKTVLGKDTIKDFDDFIESLRQLREAGINLEDVNATMQKRVSTGFLNLVADTEGVKDLADALKNCTGELDAMAEKMENTLSGATKKLANSWNALMLTFSESNGFLKEFVTTLDQLIDRYAKWRRVRQGGESAISAYEQGINDRDYKRDVKNYDQQIEAATKGKSGKELKDAAASIYENIQSGIAESLKQKQDRVNEWMPLLSYWDQREQLYGLRSQLKDGEYNSMLANLESKYGAQIAELFGKKYGLSDVTYKGGYKAQLLTGEGRDFLFDNSENGARKQLYQLIAKWRDDISTLESVAAKYSEIPKALGGTGGRGTDDIRNNGGLNLREQLSKSAVEGVDGALLRYEIAIKEAALEYEAGKLNKKQYDQRILSAMESVFKAYGTAAATIGSPEYIAGFKEWAEKISAQAGEVASDERVKKWENAQLQYERAMEKAAMELEAGVIDEIGYAKAQLSAQQALTNVYEELALETDSEGWKAAFNAAVANTKQFAETLARLTEEANQLKNARTIDRKTLNGLLRVASGARKSMSDEMLGGQSTMEYFGLAGIKDRMTADLKLDVPDEEWQALVSHINEKLEALNLPKIELDVETGNITKLNDEIKDTSTRIGYITDTISSVGSALQSLEDPGAKVAGIVAGAIANIIMAFSMASASAAKYGALPWIAATASGLATMISTIEAIKQVEFHAGGGFAGMDGMRPRGTDVVPAMLTPGELVLNRAQQGALANQLQGAGKQMVVVQVSGRVSGKDILLAGNNYNRARGGSRGAYTKIK